MLKVFIVNDSPVLTAVMREIVMTEPGYTVMGSAVSGNAALDVLTPSNIPDIVLMDIHMPGLNGVETTRRLLARFPHLRVLITTATVRRNQYYVFHALAAGASDFVRSPSLSQPPGTKVTRADLREAGKNLLHKMRVLEQIQDTEPGVSRPRAARVDKPARPQDKPRGVDGTVWVGIGSSTGGPTTLSMLLSSLPRPFPASIIICQHISAGFEKGLADWLTDETGFETTVVERRVTPQAGQAYICPGGVDLIANTPDSLRVVKPLDGYAFKPNINRFYESLAKQLGPRASAVQLTGMGADGAEGIVAVRQAGGRVYVQDKNTAVISSMPEAALKALKDVRPLDVPGIASALGRFVQGNGK